MQQVTSNVFAETTARGCNFGYLVTSEGLVMFDSPHKPSDAVALKAEMEAKGPLRYIINTEPHADHWSGNAFFNAPVVAHEGVLNRIQGTDMAEHVRRVGLFGPDEPALLDGYEANAPMVTFKNGMTLHVGNHTIEMIHMPGHTLYQAAVCIKEEGVVWTSDNIFRSVQTWIHEGNPDLWLTALESLRKLDEDIFVPGHGELCDKGYLNEQSALVQEWKEYVKSGIERGMTKDEAISNLTDLTDRYPMDVGQEGMAPVVMRMNVANLYDYLTGSWPAPSAPNFATFANWPGSSSGGR